MWFCSESSASKSFVHILGCYPVGGIFGMVIVAILAWVIVRQEVRLIVQAVFELGNLIVLDDGGLANCHYGC